MNSSKMSVGNPVSPPQLSSASFMNNNNSANTTKEYYHSNYSNRDLVGYNVLRDGELLDVIGMNPLKL